MYDLGMGVPQDHAEAARLHRLAADQGSAKWALQPWHCNLGVMSMAGTGFPQDRIEAVRLHRLAADQGHPDGQHNLAVMHAKGSYTRIPWLSERAARPTVS